MPKPITLITMLMTNQVDRRHNTYIHNLADRQMCYRRIIIVGFIVLQCGFEMSDVNREQRRQTTCFFLLSISSWINSKVERANMCIVQMVKITCALQCVYDLFLFFILFSLFLISSSLRSGRYVGNRIRFHWKTMVDFLFYLILFSECFIFCLLFFFIIFFIISTSAFGMPMRK